MRAEGFPFPGIDGDSYLSLKAVDEKYPGFTTPIDEMVARMEQEGIKVVLGRDPNSGNVLVLPLLSSNVEEDSILPRHLQTADGMDESLKALILANRAQVVSETKQS